MEESYSYNLLSWSRNVSEYGGGLDQHDGHTDGEHEYEESEVFEEEGIDDERDGYYEDKDIDDGVDDENFETFDTFDDDPHGRNQDLFDPGYRQEFEQEELETLTMELITLCAEICGLQGSILSWFEHSDESYSDESGDSDDSEICAQSPAR